MLLILYLIYVIVLMIQSFIECFKSFQKCSCEALTGSWLCGMCMFACLWGACACRVWSLCVAGAVVAVPEPRGAVKERGNELCFISFFLWRERAKKDSSSGSEIGGGGCMYVWEGSQQLSPVFLIVSLCGFWTYSRYFNDFFSLYVLKNQLKKSIMAFAVLWKQSL